MVASTVSYVLKVGSWAGVDRMIQLASGRKGLAMGDQCACRSFARGGTL
jgi:hypothetical protein